MPLPHKVVVELQVEYKVGTATTLRSRSSRKQLDAAMCLLMHVTWTQSSRSMSINEKLEAIRRMEMDENKGRGQKSFELLREVFEQIEEIEKKQVDGEKVKPIVCSPTQCKIENAIPDRVLRMEHVKPMFHTISHHHPCNLPLFVLALSAFEIGGKSGPAFEIGGKSGP